MLNQKQMESAGLRWLREFDGHGVFVVDRELAVVVWNHWLSTHSGHSEGDMLGRNLLEAYPDIVRRGLDARLQEVLEGQALFLSQETHGCFLTFPDQGAGSMPQDTHLSPLWEETQVLGVVGVVKDVAERVELIREMTAQVAQMQAMQTRLQVQVARLHLLNQITRSVAERQDLTSIFGVALSRLEQHFNVDFTALLLADHAAAAWSVALIGQRRRNVLQRQGMAAGSVVPTAECPFPEALDGRTVYLADVSTSPTASAVCLVKSGIGSAVAAPLMVEGKVTGLLVAGRCEKDAFQSEDVEFLRHLAEQVALAAHHAELYEDVRRSYQELRATQRQVLQQERLRSLGQLASGIAHDINNALSPIVGYAELLSSVETNLSDRAKKYVDTIRRSADDITHTVSRMRQFYRKREETDQLSPLDVNPLLEQVVDMTEPRWRDVSQRNGIDIEVTVEPAGDVPPVLGAENELREALVNLVLNAVDALPHGGRITLRTRAEHRTPVGEREATEEAKSPTHVLLEVIDTGVGMDEETRRHCLDPFFTRKGERGTGLGLAMVFGAMDRHGGQVEVDSAVGKGTTMRLVLPVAEAAVATPERVADAAEQPTSLRILCLDDEPTVLDLLAEQLSALGHNPVPFADGEAALAAIAEEQQNGRPFDVLLTDLGMPRMDGREFAKRAKALAPDTPILMVTGWGLYMDADSNLPEGVAAVLGKPPLLNDLRDTIQRVVG